MKRKWHVNFSENGQFYPIHYLGVSSNILCIVNSEIDLPATLFSPLYVCLQHFWPLLTAVYTLHNISTQVTVWNMNAVQ